MEPADGFIGSPNTALRWNTVIAAAYNGYAPQHKIRAPRLWAPGEALQTEISLNVGDIVLLHDPLLI
jgi:hypothetical protein